MGDAPAMDANIATTEFNDVNPKVVAFDVLPKELISDHKVAFDRNGEAVDIQFKGNQASVIRHGNAGKLMGEMSLVPEKLTASLAENLNEYKMIQNAVEQYETKEGKKELVDILKREKGVVGNKELNDELDEIMSRMQGAIAKHDSSIKDNPYVYFIANDSHFNAQCSFNRVLTVNKGTFSHFAHDSQIAAVVAHEIGHGEYNHMRNSKKELANSCMGLALLGMKNDNGLVPILANRVSSLGTDRGAERQADDVSFQYMIDAGYNPGACAAIWQHEMDITNKVVTQKGKVEQLLNMDSHAGHQNRRDNFLKKLTDYSHGQVTYKDGSVYVNGERLCSPGNIDKASGAERACLLMGQLSKLYHDGMAGKAIYVNQNKLMVGNEVVMEAMKSDEDVMKIAERWRGIQQNMEEAHIGVEWDEQVKKSGIKSDITDTYSFMKQYDKNGNEIKLKGVDTVQGKAILEAFSHKVEETVKNLNEINIKDGKREAGQKAGEYMASLLENENSVKFFTLLEKESKLASSVMGKAGNIYTKDNVNYILHDKSGLAKERDEYSSDIKEVLFDKAGLSTANSSLSDAARLQEDSNFRLDVGYPVAHYNIFSVVLENNNDKEFQEGFASALAQHPKALENYDLIKGSQHKVLQNLNELRLDSYGRQKQLDAAKLKRIQRNVKDISHSMNEYAKTNSDEASDSLTKHLHHFTENYDEVKSSLSESQEAVEWMRDKGYMTKGKSEAELQRITKMKDKMVQMYNDVAARTEALAEWSSHRDEKEFKFNANKIKGNLKGKKVPVRTIDNDKLMGGC